MKEILKKINLMELEILKLKIKEIIKVNLKIIKLMEMEFLLLIMEKNLKVIY